MAGDELGKADWNLPVKGPRASGGRAENSCRPQRREGKEASRLFPGFAPEPLGGTWEEGDVDLYHTDIPWGTVPEMGQSRDKK